MATEVRVKFFQVIEFPALPLANSFYWKIIGNKFELRLTTTNAAYTTDAGELTPAMVIALEAISAIFSGITIVDNLSQIAAGGVLDARQGKILGQLIELAKARANHTGTQLAATISDFQAKVLEYAPSVGGGATLPNCIEFNGTPQTIDFGIFYEFDKDLGDCFYETWCKMLSGGGSGKYDWSEGDGGAHAMLRNPVNGNTFRGAIVTNASNATPIVITTEKPHGFITGNSLMYIRGVLGNTGANNEGAVVTVISATTFSINGSVGNGAYTSGGAVAGAGGYGQAGIVSFGADAFPYVGQFAHSATGFSDGMVVQYYDGVPVGAVPFIGARICPNAGGNGKGHLGGSDHSNFIGRIAQYRIFEGTNPYKDIVGGGSYQLAAFQPQTVLGSQCKGIDSNLLMRVSVPETTVADLSKGYPTGVSHAGQVRGTGLGARNERATYPAPQFTYDATIPNPLGLTAPVQPAGRAYSPLAVPVGALVFDSIERKNSTYAFDGVGGMGSTEGGSLGALAWTQPDVYNVLAGTKPFGILNESFVYLVNDNNRTVAHVAIAQTNLDIRVSRTASDTYGMGISTGIAFRVTDMNNFCSVDIRHNS